MKKVFLYVILALTAASCSLDDGNQYTADELVPIESVVLPDTLDFQETYDFEITYERPTDCHSFLGYSYDSQENERTIAVINRIYYDENSNLLEKILAKTADIENSEWILKDVQIYSPENGIFKYRKYIVLWASMTMYYF